MVKRTDGDLAGAALELARTWRRVYTRGGFEGREPAELQAMLSLRVNPEQTVAELAETLELARPSVSNAVRALRDSGLVAARPAPEDARSQHLVLTTKGKVVVARFLIHAAPHLER